MTPKYYYLDGTVSEFLIKHKIFHRKDGPAIEEPIDNFYAWIQYGRLHRLDGPAIIKVGVTEYWIDGSSYNRYDWKYCVEQIKNMSILEKLTHSKRWIRELGKEEKDDNM